MRQAHPLIPLLFIIVFETLAKVVNQEKKDHSQSLFFNLIELCTLKKAQKHLTDYQEIKDGKHFILHIQFALGFDVLFFRNECIHVDLQCQVMQKTEMQMQQKTIEQAQTSDGEILSIPKSPWQTRRFRIIFRIIHTCTNN